MQILKNDSPYSYLLILEMMCHLSLKQSLLYVNQ